MTNPSRTPRVGRPRSEAAESHEAILDAVHEMLKEKPARELTMDAVAKRAKVGKPTLYKWWPSKAALVMAVFHERLSGRLEAIPTSTIEAALRARVQSLIVEFNGLFGKVMGDLIAEGQSDPAVLRELYEQHIRPRRTSAVALIDQGKAAGEFAASVDAELLVDAIFGPIYYRLLLRSAPLTKQYGNRLIDLVLSDARGVRKRVKAG